VANSKVALVMRVRLADGKRVYAAPAITKNGKIKPLAAIVGGKVENHPEGVYALRYRDHGRLRYLQVGTDVDAAETAKLRFELDLRKEVSEAETIPTVSDSVPAQGLPPAPSSPVPAEDKRKSRLQAPLSSLRNSFIDRYAHGSADTVHAYTNVANEFVELATKREKHTPAELDEGDVIAYDRYLESKGNSKSTRAGRYGYVRCFLRYCGLNPTRTDDQDETSGVVTAAQHKKLKAILKLAVENFSEADLQRLYAASSERHRLIWKTFRMVGLRDEELAYTFWSNIDWERRLWLVRFKPAGSFPWNPKLAWKSKDCEEREIPIPVVLYDELKTWRAKTPGAQLVFPTSGGQADIKLLKALKSDWRKAGLNCGHCNGCLGPKNECGKAKLKTFRATYLSTMLRYLDLRSVQDLAGHSDIATTQKYLAPAAHAVIQNAANAAFGST